jgi:hypothetical protein
MASRCASVGACAKAGEAPINMIAVVNNFRREIVYRIFENPSSLSLAQVKRIRSPCFDERHMIDQATRWYPHFMVWSVRLSPRIPTTSPVSGSILREHVAALAARDRTSGNSGKLRF